MTICTGVVHALWHSDIMFMLTMFMLINFIVAFILFYFTGFPDLSWHPVSGKYNFIEWSPGMEVSKTIPPFRYFSNFQHCITQASYWISHWYLTSVKYQCGQNNIIGTFARSKIMLAEKFTNGDIVIHTPGLWNVYVLPISLETLYSSTDYIVI